jgi:carboxyl-terminal processing protease
MSAPTSSLLQVRLPLLLALTLAIGMFIGQKLPHSDHPISYVPSGRGGAASGALDEVLRYIDALYVDSVDINRIKAGAIEHLLGGLDPHSVYISPDELKAVEDDMSGGFEGIGIEFLMVDDTMQVVAPLSGGPSEAAGILPGDKIVMINDTVIAGVKMDNGNIFRRLRGEKGSIVKVGILRGRESALRQFQITRDVIPVKSVETAYMIDERTGYIKINRFSARTYQEFMESVRPMAEEQGMQHLILDLRGNPGGYLSEATSLLSQFFGEGKLLVYTEGRKDARRDYKSTGRARFNIQQMAVLIDEGSASASEIVAGAIQDHDRGWVIGRRSFGKGLVQEQYPLQDGGALRLTISRYYTPSGRSIQRKYGNGVEYDHEGDRRLQNGELTDGTKMKQNDSTQYYTGQGRIVYAGGGITPDVFIPIDTSYVTNYYQNIRTYIPQFLARWMESHDKSLYPNNISTFIQDYQPDEAILEALVSFGQKEGVPRNDNEIKRSKEEIKFQIKVRLAKLLFQETGMYKVLNSDDPAIEKAKQLVKSGEPVAKK